MMISLEDVFEFYTRISFEPSNTTWKEILECLQHSDARDFAYARTVDGDKETLLNCHFRSRITGKDNDEIAVARMLIERSIDMGGMQEHGDSVLTVSNRYGSTPLHDLLKSIPSIQHSHIRYVELIIEMSARVDEKRQTSFYWNELMLKQDAWGCTPLHKMNPLNILLFLQY
jgi:hypothetical protein